MSRLKGSGGAVYVGQATIDNCEDAWNEQVDTDVTASLDTDDYKIGSGSCKFEVAAGLTDGDIIASEVVSVDLSAYTQVLWWAKSSVAINTAGDLQMLLDEDALCASPLTVNFPALAANTWTPCSTAADMSDYDATISVGVKLAANDPGAFNLWLDHIMAAKSVAGIKSWSIDYTMNVEDVTGFDSSGHKAFIPTIDEWSGSFEGFKDGAPLSIGSVVLLELRESSTSTQQWRGSAIVTAVHPNVGVAGVVTYGYDFQGTGALTVASA